MQPGPAFSINPSFIASMFTCSFQHQLILRHRIVDWQVLMSTGGNCRRCTLLNRPPNFRSLRVCLHDTGPTFAPERVHSGSLSWLLTFVYMIPPQNVMPARVTPAWIYPGCCTGVRISLRYEITQRYHVNAKRLHVSVLRANAQKNRAKSANRGHSSKPNHSYYMT